MPSLNGFDANTVEPKAPWEPIPENEYNVMITDSEMKQTKAGTGQYLELTFQILDGEQKDRTLRARLNLDNPNETTVRIAQAELSAICRAVGKMQPQDSVELHNIPLVIKVRVKRRKDTGDLTNEIASYAPKGSLVADAAPDTAPWKRD